MNRGDFQRIALIRLAEAQILLDAGHFSGSYYLGGYAVECALKACITRNIRAEEMPEKNFGSQVYTHELSALLNLAGLATKAPLDGDADLDVNWATVKDWTEQSRYVEKLEIEARELIAAIDDDTHGVLAWLKQHW
jgi:HEPN domain-containing protein